MANFVAEPEASAEKEKVRAPAGEGTRLHISLPPEVLQRLKTIQTETYATSLTEVIKNSLIVYAALLSEHKKGREIYTRGTDGPEARLPIFL
ncbi:hypothetical protein [Bradyrhizobium sp. OK095]|uniref:hypothetical protein n=1 Tax=Bradyrhizobium sp. OK095 TaxID=1882760 RepID=UPI0008B35F5F|nr:hypothetical protein [Bradyrhizobium sp. OK095]SEM74212.1 hypothetical protein SAMN05443254_103506 [Bradyrhizobium sp. OK095]